MECWDAITPCCASAPESSGASQTSGFCSCRAPLVALPALQRGKWHEKVPNWCVPPSPKASWGKQRRSVVRKAPSRSEPLARIRAVSRNVLQRKGLQFASCVNQVRLSSVK